MNSDFMSDVDNRKSILGYVFLDNDGAINLKSFKHPIIADSAMKAAYIAASKAAKKAFWFKKFIVKLGVMPSNTIALHCDNNDAIALAKEPKSHQKSSI